MSPLQFVMWLVSCCLCLGVCVGIPYSIYRIVKARNNKKVANRLAQIKTTDISISHNSFADSQFVTVPAELKERIQHFSQNRCIQKVISLISEACHQEIRELKKIECPYTEKRKLRKVRVSIKENYIAVFPSSLKVKQPIPQILFENEHMENIPIKDINFMDSMVYAIIQGVYCSLKDNPPPTDLQGFEWTTRYMARTRYPNEDYEIVFTFSMDNEGYEGKQSW